MKSFAGKVAAITGAGSGMGRALALALARRGCEVALSDVKRTTIAMDDTYLYRLSEEEIQAYYKAHPDQFTRLPTAYLSFVALPRLTDASDSAAAYQRALAVRQEILDGAPFAEIAARESSDSISASKGPSASPTSASTRAPATPCMPASPGVSGAIHSSAACTARATAAGPGNRC